VSRVSIFDSGPDRWELMHRVRVFLDDVEVTRQCQIADEELGEVQLLKRDADGHSYLDRVTREPAIEIKRGRVRIELTPKGEAGA
jgi:hypothetical protein